MKTAIIKASDVINMGIFNASIYTWEGFEKAINEKNIREKNTKLISAFSKDVGMYDKLNKIFNAMTGLTIGTKLLNECGYEVIENSISKTGKSSGLSSQRKLYVFLSYMKEKVMPVYMATEIAAAEDILRIATKRKEILQDMFKIFNRGEKDGVGEN